MGSYKRRVGGGSGLCEGRAKTPFGGELESMSDVDSWWRSCVRRETAGSALGSYSRAVVMVGILRENSSFFVSRVNSSLVGGFSLGSSVDLGEDGS